MPKIDLNLSVGLSSRVAGFLGRIRFCPRFGEFALDRGKADVSWPDSSSQEKSSDMSCILGEN